MRRTTAAAVLLTLTGSLAVPLGLPSATAASGSATGAVPRPGSELDPSFGPAARRSALADAHASAPVVARALRLSPRETLVARTVERDLDGTEHLRYDRTVAGLAVIGGDLVAHRDSRGRIVGADYATDQSLASVPTRPSVSGSRAARVALAGSGVTRGRTGTVRLVVWAVEGFPRLAWEVGVAGTDADGQSARRVEYVDALRGDHLAGWSTRHYADGTGKSLYLGKVKIATETKRSKKGKTYLLKDRRRGGSTTVDALNKQDRHSYIKGRLFQDKNNVWGNGTNSNRQSAAVDVAFGTAATWDYYKSTFQRVGIRGDGKGAKSRVHYGKKYENAFWDDGCFCMTYGDGAKFFRPLVSLDVAGHEMTHGVTSHTAGLIYFGESGGLNEATSDIFGTIVEFDADNRRDPGDYYIGETIAKKAAVGTAFLRRMDQPGADGYSYDCTTATMGADDVHLSSGPANKFFYLLAEGTGPKTFAGLPHEGIACDGSSLTGIGRAAAADIWYRALTVYLTSSDGYSDARDATIRAALDLGGHCAAVEAAWDAVSVDPYLWSCAGPHVPGPNVLVDPGFESGGIAWSPVDSAFVTDDPFLGFPHSGTQWASFNGRGLVNTGTMSQLVTVPDSNAAVLRFQLLNYSEDDPSAEYDFFCVAVGPSSSCLSNQQHNNTYTPYYVDLATFRGQTVLLQFTGFEDEAGATAFLLDDVSLSDG